MTRAERDRLIVDLRARRLDADITLTTGQVLELVEDANSLDDELADATEELRAWQRGFE